MKNIHLKHIVRNSVILIGLILPSFYLVGCDEHGVKPGQQQIITAALEAMAEVRSCNVVSYLTEDYVVVSDNSTTAQLWQMTGQKRVDIAGEKLYLSMDIREATGAHTSPYVYQKYISDDMEFLDNSMFSSGAGNPWRKTRLESEPDWPELAGITLKTELLSGGEILGPLATGYAGGAACYVISVIPHMQAAADWVLAQEPEMGPTMGWFRMDTERSRQIYWKSYKSGVARFWIEKDTYRIRKVSVDLLFDAAPGTITLYDTGLPVTGNEDTADLGFQHILRDFSGEWEFYGYNENTDIELPEEALKAEEKT